MRFNMPDHFYGEERVIKRFALLPIRAGTEIRWLTRCITKQVWMGRWRNEDFVNPV